MTEMDISQRSKWFTELFLPFSTCLHLEQSITLLNYILLVTQCTIVLIRKNIGSIKFISGEANRADMNFIDPIFFRLRTIVHCVTNFSLFCNQTSYLMFSILGQWIYHDFESIQPCISSISFPWDMEFVMVLSPYFTSDSILFSYYDNKFILLLYPYHQL
jgi:hypothetical protein